MAAGWVPCRRVCVGSNPAPPGGVSLILQHNEHAIGKRVQEKSMIAIRIVRK